MPRKSSLDPALADWLNHTVYPHLTHAQVFGELDGFHETPTGDFYADCPRCHRSGTFYGYQGRQVGTCKSCGHVIGWFAYLRWPDRKTENDRAVRVIAQLAGVTTGPNGQPLVEPDSLPENPDSGPGTPYPPTTNPDP